MGVVADIRWSLVTDVLRGDNHGLRPLDDPVGDPPLLNVRYVGDDVIVKVQAEYTKLTYTVTNFRVYEGEKKYIYLRNYGKKKRSLFLKVNFSISVQ